MLPDRRSDRHAPRGVAGAVGDPMTGRVLDRRYRVGRRIARGGMASVYEATDLRLDRTVAVKIMHAGLGDDEAFAARFVREAHAAARLSHPNVVAVFDQGREEDGTVFLAMELVVGSTLRDVIRSEAPLAPARALALMEPVLSALAAAHRAGLVHRDVKPENVLLASDRGGDPRSEPDGDPDDPVAGFFATDRGGRGGRGGPGGPGGPGGRSESDRVKVADFGLARAVSADTQHTLTGGVLIGTVSYLAPELVVDGRADARADVYAAGVVLFELLTGSKPHEGESPIQVAYKHVHEDVPPPSSLVPDIPAYVDALVARATARDRGLRPADAGVLLRQLRRVAMALADGVPEDPELTADLTPLLLAGREDPTAAVPGLADLAVAPGLTAGAAEAGAIEPDDLTTAVATLPPLGATGLVGPPGSTGTPGSWDPTPGDAQDAPAGRAPGSPPDSGTGGPSGGAPREPRTPGGPRPEGRPARSAGPVRRQHSERPRRPRRSRRGLALLLASVLALVGLGTGAWWFLDGRYTSTPGVIGMTRAAAQHELAVAGLEPAYAHKAYSETVPAGRVVATDPAAGSKVLDGGSVTVTISLGKERYDVPRLVGRSAAEAADALEQTHLAVGRTTGTWSDDAPSGDVVATTPKAGTTVRPDTAVDLVVSKGPRPVRLRDWAGKDAARALAWLVDKGLTGTVVEKRYSDEVAAGGVISIDPPGGTVLHRGDEVALVVSKGPELVEVPSVRGAGVEAATERLEALGFKVATRDASGSLGLGFVWQQDPAGGTRAPKGSTITLSLI